MARTSRFGSTPNRGTGRSLMDSVAVSITSARPLTRSPLSGFEVAVALATVVLRIWRRVTCSTNSFQMRAGISPPVTPAMGVLSSFPTHTPTASSGVKPTNQASRYSCVVPVLPATGVPFSFAALPGACLHNSLHQIEHHGP